MREDTFTSMLIKKINKSKDIVKNINYNYGKGRWACILATSLGMINCPKISFDNLSDSIETTICLEYPTIILTNTCVSSIDALGIATEILGSDQADYVMVITFDYAGNFILEGLKSYNILDTMQVGFGCSEGIKVKTAIGECVLSLKTRKCKGEFEIINCTVLNDGKHLASFDESGNTLRAALNSTFRNIEITFNEIELCLVGFNGVQKHDQFLYKVLKDYFGNNFPLIFSKYCVGGHALGASGLVEIVQNAKEKKYKKVAGTGDRFVYSEYLRNKESFLAVHVGLGFSGMVSVALVKF